MDYQNQYVIISSLNNLFVLILVDNMLTINAIVRLFQLFEVHLFFLYTIVNFMILYHCV